MTFNNLSNEIHHLIVVNLTEDDLLNLRSLKSFYFDAWMDLKWNAVVLDLGADACDSLMQRISDPFVRKKIKNLSITYTSKTSSFVELLSLLILPFPSLFTLKSDGFEDPESCTTLFQTIASSPMRSTLRHLYLSAHPAALTSPVESATLKYLEVFSLHMSRADATDNNSVVIVPFLNSVSATLKALQIRNCGTGVSLAPLFVALSANPGRFRRLKTISLADGELDISAFHGFLVPYLRNLEQVELDISDQGLMEAWLDRVVNGQTTFPSLRAFKICQPTTPSGLYLLTNLIERISSTLSRLQLQRPLPNEAFPQLIGALALSNIQMLAVETHTLTIPFLYLLAGKIPRLETLKLRVAQVVPSDQNSSFWDILMQRRYDSGVTPPTQDALHRWKLRYLVIEFVSRQPPTIHEVLCHLLANAVPSVEEIRCQGLPFTEDQDGHLLKHCDHFEYSRGY